MIAPIFRDSRWRLVAEMEKNGIGPNDVTYNSLANCAASQGRFRDAWAAISVMESKGTAGWEILQTQNDVQILLK